MGRLLSRIGISILDRYIFAELFGVFIMALSIVMSILYLEKVHFLSRLILDKGIGLVEFVKLLAYLTPAFLTVSIPLAMLLASLIAFSRLSTDSEITAMRACGVGFSRLLWPVILLSALVFAANLYLSVKLQYAGNYRYIMLLRSIITEKVALSIGERVFFDKLKNTVIYVNEKPTGSQDLKGVFLYDANKKERPEYITARQGRFVTSGGQVVLQLQDGNIYTGDEAQMRLTRFGTYEMQFNATPEGEGGYVIQPREMSVPALRKRVEERKAKGKEYHDDEVEIHKRYALPFSAVMLALLGAPLGIRSQRSGTRGGVGTGIVVIIFNYLLLMLAEGLGREGQVQPALAMWMPNVILFLVALGMVWAAQREAGPFAALQWVGYLWSRVARMLWRKG